MTEWIHVNTNNITRIGYNKDLRTLIIDFVGSACDTPYKNVTEKTFVEFTQAERIDEYYNIFIKDIYKPSEIHTESTIVYNHNLKS